MRCPTCALEFPAPPTLGASGGSLACPRCRNVITVAPQGAQQRSGSLRPRLVIAGVIALALTGLAALHPAGGVLAIVVLVLGVLTLASRMRRSLLGLLLGVSPQRAHAAALGDVAIGLVALTVGLAVHEEASPERPQASSVVAPSEAPQPLPPPPDRPDPPPPQPTPPPDGPLIELGWDAAKAKLEADGMRVSSKTLGPSNERMIATGSDRQWKLDYSRVGDPSPPGCIFREGPVRPRSARAWVKEVTGGKALKLPRKLRDGDVKRTISAPSGKVSVLISTYDGFGIVGVGPACDE